ncbi:MAG: hypothetical protein H6838_17475 [Planctomycetes bacterium]|nr:hypothetical protein [Planctomycetota bacterium]
MSLRKEQVLALLTLLLAAWIWNGRRQPLVMVDRITMKQLDYEPGKVAETPLAGPGDGQLRRRDFATEPSETQPLPPRPLAFPPRAPRSIVMLPLDPGPDFGHALQLAGDGAVVEGVTLAEPGEAETAAAPEEQGGQDALPSTRAEREAIAARSYDRVFLQNQSGAFYGTIEQVDGLPKGKDKYDLEKMISFEGVTIHMRRYNVDSGKVGRVDPWRDDDRTKIAKVVLADTMRNEIVRRTRDIAVDGAHLEERAEAIRWLLDRAREDSSIYKDALAQADLYAQGSGGNLESLRWQQRVLQAKGDLQAEYALLDGISGVHRETAFRYEGLGRLKARLGLYVEAEQDLRRAVQLEPNDARPHAALAEFLRRRGRSHEAVASARRAEQTFGSLLDAGDKLQAARTVLACYLAVADVDAARDALRLAGGGGAQPYLDGAVKYAAGEVDAALVAFRLVTGPDAGRAQLGQAACMVRLGQWQEAHDTLVRVADLEPLLRARADTGLALLYLRLGQYDNALAWLDRAQEADPIDPYQFYLRGAVLRLQGNLDAAEEALLSCLRLRDDFVHALVEMTALLSSRALEGGVTDASAALAAMRYGERAAQLAFRPTVELYQLQGLLRFFSGDARLASEAFAAARDLADTEQGKLFAKGALAVVAYSRGQREDAEDALTRLSSDLPKEDPMRVWAETTLAQIDDHGQKEMLGDGFERNDLGRIWIEERDGAWRAQVRDGALVFDGTLSRNGAGEVFVRRNGAVPKGKNFLAVGVKMRLGAGQPRTEGFSGLRITTQRGAGRDYDLRAQLGVREGKPYLLIEENQAEPVKLPLDLGDVDLAAWQELELRVVPRGDQGRNFNLQASWNGRVVRSHELKTLTASTGNTLETVLFAGGNKGGRVDVEFDEYRLERRKER